MFVLIVGPWCITLEGNVLCLNQAGGDTSNTSTDNPSVSIGKERYEPGVHTINNANPYQGMTVTEGHGKYPVIFEPLQNIQTSRSTYKVTSFVDFARYLEYFQQFKRYLEAFKASIGAFENDPILQEF